MLWIPNCLQLAHTLTYWLLSTFSFLHILPISSLLTMITKMCSRLYHLKLLSLPLWLQAPCSSPSVSLKHIIEQTLGFLICSSISIHFTPRCNGGSSCYFTETVWRSPMTSPPKTMCILSAYYCGWPVEETRLPWFLNFKNSSALLSCELALAVAELTYTVLVTNRWSRWCYCSWNYLIHPKIHPCLFPLK